MTHFLDPDAIRSRTEGIVHLDTQRSAVGLDLTAGSLFRVTGRGALDFGGSEWAAAAREKLEPRLRSQDDDYGWW